MTTDLYFRNQRRKRVSITDLAAFHAVPGFRHVGTKISVPLRLRVYRKFSCNYRASPSVQPSCEKYSASAVGQISFITPPVSWRMRGVGHRHERAVRCDG